MCGIAGILSLNHQPIPNLRARLERMSALLAHRGPDGTGIWIHPDNTVGLSHVRLAIIDTGTSGAQPMHGAAETVISFNGEIYNYPELRLRNQARGYPFTSSSDTETILAEYVHNTAGFLDQLRGMFAFGLWDGSRHRLLLGRDRVGIKPLYYTVQGEYLYFASEIKALVPFLPEINTNRDALADYLTFQYMLSDHTLFTGVHQVPPAHYLVVDQGAAPRITRYWDLTYDIDYVRSQSYFTERLRSLLEESMDLHLRSDVEIGAYVSGGIDSSLIAASAARGLPHSLKSFHGTFPGYKEFDESKYADIAVNSFGGELFTAGITALDFERDFRNLVYHLDHPVAGPGSFPQFEVSALAASKLKVVLGGQGGDEIFGGYARYLIAYLEQCLRASIDGTSANGNFVVTLESIIPNLGVLREYQPLLQQFWSEGLFGPLDERYFRLLDRSSNLGEGVAWERLDMAGVRDRYLGIFNSTRNVRKEAYFDSMTHFDFKTLLPALLHVEDRVSMAHGLESRVPLLDHHIIEFAATVPADIKFKGGKMKRLLKNSFKDTLPREIRTRRDKMGFPVPLEEWIDSPLRRMALGLLESLRDRQDDVFRSRGVERLLTSRNPYSRVTWGLMSLEMWMQIFHDQASSWRWDD